LGLVSRYPSGELIDRDREQLGKLRVRDRIGCLVGGELDAADLGEAGGFGPLGDPHVVGRERSLHVRGEDSRECVDPVSPHRI
jgi:hypothetical protein